ncbi:hypothetical protein [Candidatus Pelagibacter sp.]|uniref:hypothetical protein n=1 Tax=Candidatus Pelagibacter sp. TaxID=2024849 RepID=UPI003F835140
MVKIPTYNSRLTPQPTFTKPVAPKGLAENIKTVANYANSIADERAEIKAYEKGFKQQKDNFNNFVANFDDASISGSAYTKGARAAFVSNFKTNAENDLNDIAIKHQYEPEKYKQKFDAYREKNLANVPSVLLPDVSSWLDGFGNRLNRNIIANERAFNQKQNLVDITNRFEVILPQMTQSIIDNGYDTNTSIDFYAELLSSITSLEENNVDPVRVNNLKLKLKDEVINSSIVNAFNKAEDKQTFIANVQKGNISELLNDVNDTYKAVGFEFNTSLSSIDAQNVAGKLNTILKYDIANTKIERQNYDNNFTTWYTQSINGFDAGETPSIDAAEKLYFSDLKIDEYKNKIEIVNIIAPDINKSRYSTLSESQNLLKEAQSQLLVVTNQTPSADRNKDLTILEAKVEALTEQVSFKQDAINEGNPFKILSRMGFNYSFENEDDIAKAHELVKSNVGISAERMLVMPQSNLEAYKEEFETADSQTNALAIVGKYKTQFGKYEQAFLNDVNLTDGYRVVFDFVEKEPATAGTIWQSITDREQNETALKNSREDFKADSDEFALKFKENFGEAFRGNEDLFNEIYAGAYSFYLKNLATIGDNEKAINNTINKFSNTGGIYQFVEINEQPVFIPPGVDGNAIAKNVNDMLDNPHRYNITSGANFTLQDIAENKDEYTVVVEGGTAKLIQNSNILFAAEIYQKLPSGSNEFVYSDVMVSTDDGITSETSMTDFDETWSYDKPKNLNAKINSQVKKTKLVESIDNELSPTTIEVDTNTFEKITDLKEIVYKEIADDEGINYADVFSGDLAVTTRDMQNLNAISLYIKDGEIQPYILDYLSTFDYLGKLKNKDVQKEVMKQWKDKSLRVRTTSNTESALMTPLQSLTDIVRSIEIAAEVTTTENFEGLI